MAGQSYAATAVTQAYSVPEAGFGACGPFPAENAAPRQTGGNGGRHFLPEENFLLQFHECVV